MEIKNPTPATPPATAPKWEKPNAGDILACGEYALRIIGHPAHHTTIYETLKKAGLWTDKSHNVNPRMWSDWRNDRSKTRFRFYGQSVFGLKEWGARFPETGTDPDPYRPQRGTVQTQVPVTAESIAEKIARLQRELTDAQAALKELKK